MDEPNTQQHQAVTISVERMIRFCYLSQMEVEYVRFDTKVLPLHLTRFGAMIFETASFLYSLFDDTNQATNLLKIWKGFDHPFNDELISFAEKLEPFKDELRKVRNRIGFHGSLTRSHEKAGLGIFDVNSQRAREFARLVREMQNIALKMIKWYTDGMNESDRPRELWQEFMIELRGYRVERRESIA